MTDLSLVCSRCGTDRIPCNCPLPTGGMAKPTPWSELPPHVRMTYQSQKQYELHAQGRAAKIEQPTMAERYPQYYKDVRHLDYIDVYQVHHLFQIDDPSGCLQHADKKILLSGVRTGGKPKRKDIEEARDTLTRWLELQGGANG